MSLVEIVPNVSEGRNKSTLAELASSFGESGAHLLDTHSDPDHHRTAFTGVGDISSIHQTALSLVEKSLSSIDLTQHQGVHPRIGAVDVVPLVSLNEILPDAPEASVLVERASVLATDIARRFEIPVFLYGEAAREADHRELSFLRRGGFESMNSRIALGELLPPFGPKRVHPRVGAMAIGVRKFLIAFNVFLASDGERIAKAIAAKIRTSSGGLPDLQAIGVFHRQTGRAQVSMNLTNYKRTSLLTAFDAVRAQANALGVSVSESEVVGVIPRGAWSEELQERLRLPVPPPVLEELLEQRGLI